MVDRERAIRAFVAVPYWGVEVTLAAAGQSFVAGWLPPAASVDDEGRCLRQEVALQAAERVNAAGSARVLSLETEHVRQAPPLPFDLGTLQTLCSRQLGLDVQETLNIAQALYETHKACTYPRSDSGYLPASMFAEVPAVLEALLLSDPTLGPVIDRLHLTQRSRAWDDARVSAHHGIIPTAEPINLAAMSERERAVYQLIRDRYLVQFLPHHEFERTTVRLACGDEVLQAAGRKILVPGWRELPCEPELSEAQGEGEAFACAQVLPTLQHGLACGIEQVELKSASTLPPRPYPRASWWRP